MTYPVPPPEPHSIIQTLPADLSPASNSRSGVSFNQLSTPDSPVSVAKSAALLGPPLSVSYPVGPVKTSLRALLRSSDRREPPLGLRAASPNPAVPQKQPVVRPTSAPIPPFSPKPHNTLKLQSQPSSIPPLRRIVEINSDRQEYDEQRQIVTAEGKVLVRFDGAVLDADRLNVNLQNLIAVGEGNVALTRGAQVLRGEKFTYNIIQNSGNISNGSGEIYIPTAGSDFSPTLPTDITAGGVAPRPPSDRITANQPLQQVTNTGGIGFTFGGPRNVSNIPLPPEGGSVKRLRFEAEQIEFYSQGWQASDVRITNDPFSPSELELRADTVTLTRETPLRDRIKTTRQRLVFDQGLTVRIPRDEAVIDRSQRDVSPALAELGYDGEDRGGVFVERGFTPIDTDRLRVRLTPQFFLQRAVTESSGNVFDSQAYGLKTRIDGNLGPRTILQGSGVFTSLDLNEVEDNLRASLRLRQVIGTRVPHTLGLEYSYRDRLYNGSLGYQTVQSSLGGVLTSPIIPLGRTGINLSYQAGAQAINAETDRPDLLESVRENNRASLSRFQGSAAVSRGFLLWQGKALPATATEGLRYTAAPVVPYLVLNAGVTGTTGFYSNGDNQSTLIGSIGLIGQIGHFSRPFLDYTNFNITYSQGSRSGISPFLFDRAGDTSVISAGVTQQIYGPFRLGVQAALNLDTGDLYNTDFVLEYSRRTYGIALRYNPDLALGSLSLRISDFNWAGGSDPFSDSGVRPVVGGVRQVND